MPKVKIDHVVSFSSEDPAHTANNILSSDPAKKWKCRTPGETMANVVLQLEKASNITSIDVGNENSAYIEILVSRSGSDEDFKPLLVMSSFMTPLESRQSTNINKVRMFNFDDLSDPEKKEKWDRVKIVCTQPFNRHVQYGLSFINLHTTEAKTGETKNPVSNTIGKFTLRPDSPDSLSTGSLFARRKELQKEHKEEQLKGAAAIREASSTKTLEERGTPVSKKKIKLIPNSSRQSLEPSEDDAPKQRNRNELLYSRDEEEKNSKIDKIIEKKAVETQAKKEKEMQERKAKEMQDKKAKEEKKTKELKHKEKDSTPKQNRKKENSSNSEKKPTSAKKNQTISPAKNSKRKPEDVNTSINAKKRKQSRQTKPFSKLLEGVVIVISGIQNPDRANLRTSALLLGAKYKPDWDNSCTHLICAFQNTPKFNQVKGKGKIITRLWIEDCYKYRKRFPWRSYALDPNDKNQEESEEEVWEKTDETPPSSPQPETSYSARKKQSEPSKPCTITSHSEIVDSDTEDNNQSAQNHDRNGTNSDTEDEIERINASSKCAKNISGSDTEDDLDLPSCSTKVKDIYTVDTEPEEIPELKPCKNIPDRFKDFFDQKRFYVDTSFSGDTIFLLKRHIVAYNGIFVDDPTENIDIIITTKEHVESIREINENAVCLSPKWIAECHNTQKLVSMDEYMLQ